MTNLVRHGAGLRLLMMCLLWALVPASAWAHVHQSAPSGHAGTWGTSNHAPESGRDAAASRWQAVPLPCDHCGAGTACDWGRDCTPGGLPLLARIPTIEFAIADRVPAGWTPDHPLAENPTPPIPPPLQIL